MSLHFRLEAVLRLRRAECAQVRGALAVAHEAARTARGALDAETARARATSAHLPPDNAEALRAVHQDGLLAAARVAAAEAIWRDATLRVETAAHAYVAAKRRVAVLERLEERRRSEAARAAARAEAVVLDEIATARHRAGAHPGTS